MPFKPGQSGNPSTQFTSDNQPSNRGANRKKITQYLKQIGEAKRLTFNITITNQDGTKTRKKGAISSRGKDYYEILATMLWIDAIKGDPKARREILDRIEGKPQTFIDLTSDGEQIIMSPEQRDEEINKILTIAHKKEAG